MVPGRFLVALPAFFSGMARIAVMMCHSINLCCVIKKKLGRHP